MGSVFWYADPLEKANILDVILEKRPGLKTSFTKPRTCTHFHQFPLVVSSHEDSGKDVLKKLKWAQDKEVIFNSQSFTVNFSPYPHILGQLELFHVEIYLIII
ncbi:hypothetical protein TNCV_3984471 [Trichonephila clavipes]|nr:hypothetical protein TNCV_3984471 [Trichonephila clavipes]